MRTNLKRLFAVVLILTMLIPCVLKDTTAAWAAIYNDDSQIQSMTQSENGVGSSTLTTSNESGTTIDETNSLDGENGTDMSETEDDISWTVEEVQEAIDELPSVEELKQTSDLVEPTYSVLLEVYEAYESLSEEEQEIIENADKQEELFEYYAELMVTATNSVSATSGGTVYLENSGISCKYGDQGWGTRIFYADGNIAYCVEPALTNTTSGTYTKYYDFQDYITNNSTSVSTETKYKQLRAALWFAYGSPGFDASLWPDTWSDGTAMTAERYIVAAHILLSLLYEGSQNNALSNCSSTFKTWAYENIIGYDGTTKLNDTAARFTTRSRADEVPDSFKVFVINPAQCEASLQQAIVGWEYEPVGYLTLTKVSANTELTENNSYYSVAGAVYTVYSEETCKNVVGKLTVEEDGSSNTLEVEAGTYYVKETTVPINGSYEKDTEIYKVVVDNDKTTTLQVDDVPLTGSISLKKSSEDELITVENDYYSVFGAVYTIYSDEACTLEIGTLTVGEDGSSNIVTGLALGIYYVKETAPPTNGSYASNATIYTVELTVKNQTVIVNATDVPYYGSLQIKKVSANPSLTEGNNYYSLADAIYYVYTDVTCGDEYQVGVLTTTADGTSNILTGLAFGTYYVKEKSASDGYAIDTEIYETELTVEVKDAVLNVQEEPLYTDLKIELEKFSVDGSEMAQKYSLEGTQFTICYYDVDDVTNETINLLMPIKTWIIEVRESISESEEVCFISALTEEYLIKEGSDELFYDSEGNVILPLGTITITETKTATHYISEGYIKTIGGTMLSEKLTKPLIIAITENSGTVSLKGTNEVVYDDLKLCVYNQPHLCSISIEKYGSDGGSLAGVSFELYDEDGNLITEAMTDEDGKLSFSDLSLGSYRLVETATVEGNSLLRDPIDVTLPVEMSEEEVASYGIDLSNCVYDENTGKYYVYDLTYYITNTVTFHLPTTGGTSDMRIWWMMMAGFGLILFALKKLFSDTINNQSRKGGGEKPRRSC